MGPLAGVRVLEIGGIGPGPLAASAEVTRNVTTRSTGSPVPVGGNRWLNRNIVPPWG